jgi:CRISPR-associated protein Cmr6
MPLIPVENKRSALDAACSLTPSDRRMMQALVERQEALARPLVQTGALMRIEAQAVGPFTTGLGLGNEHPLENGFAFLNPYGLPYLPGSGVKGVVRQSARELASGAWGDAHGWSETQEHPFTIGWDTIQLSMLDVLFGRQAESSDSRHLRGALSFWDVVPSIDGDRLAVEVMTPHQTDYYQKGKTPHESGSPNPISFLTVPPKSRFIFHVVCDCAHLRHLAPTLVEGDRWKALLEAAFVHAFQWLGFGAKTSVGYGAFERQGAQVTRVSTTSPAMDEAIWRDAVLSWHAGGGGKLTINAERGRGRAEAVGAEAQRLMQPLSAELIQQLKRRGLRADVRVQMDGNMARAVEIIVREPKDC